MDDARSTQEPGSAGVGRRAVIARGAAATALVWAAPSVLTTQAALATQGTPAPGPDPVRTQRQLRLVSSDAPAGTPDPLVEVRVGGVWRPAVAVENSLYVEIPGTGFVDAGGTCTSNTLFVFRVPFVLPAGYSSPAVSGTAQGDNYVRSVRLNASPSLGGQADMNSTAAFANDPATLGTFSSADATHFVPGTNYLYFDLINYGCPLALDLEATVTYLL